MMASWLIRHPGRVSPARLGSTVFAVAAMGGILAAAPVPFYTRAEAREAIVARAMVQGRGLVLPPRDSGRIPRKPPLYYWLAALALRSGLQPQELAVRLPNVVLGAASLGVTAAVAANVYGQVAGLLAAVILGTSFEWMRAMTQARVDMTLSAFLCASILALWLGIQRRDVRWLRAGAVSAGLATLAKGPIGLVLPLAVVVVDSALARQAQRLRRLADPLVGMLAVLPPLAWYVAAGTQGGSDFVQTQLLEENLNRFLGIGDVPHTHSLLYYPPMLAGGLLPWTPAVLVAIWQAWRRRTPYDRFLLVWVAVVIGLYALATGKRSVYLLPAYPAVAVLTGATLATWCRTAVSARVRSATIALGVVLAFGSAIIIHPAGQQVLHRILSELVTTDRDLLAPAFAVLADVQRSALECMLVLIASLVVAVAGSRPAARAAALVAFGVMVVGTTVAIGTVPLAQRLTVEPFAAAVRTLVPADASLCALGDVPDSLRWYLYRPLPHCHFECDRVAHEQWVLRTSSSPARRRALCLNARLHHPGLGPDDSLTLDRVEQRQNHEG
jgi:4-amino-4-deoxy-L-arabinose transferase-like glycosyltransferase